METLISFELLPAEIEALRQDGPRSVDLICQAIIRCHLRMLRFRAASKARRHSIRAERKAARANGHGHA
jgi:hypothetical protein